MKLILCCLVLLGLATSASIPELYLQNNRYFTNDYTVTFNSPAGTGEFGVSSEAGDLNGDGIQDFIIADPSYDNGKGLAIVMWGKPGSMRQYVDMANFPTGEGLVLTGKVAGQKLGFSVSHAGDVNGDGVDDIIIGSPFWKRDSYITEVGLIYVLFGRRNGGFAGLGSFVNLDQLAPSEGFRIYGEGSLNRAGFSVSGAGDVNGDGISDILIGAFGAGSGGKAYVIFGSRQGLADMTLPPAAGKGFTVQGSNREDFGSSVSKIGDFNGDGVDDIIIGAHCADNWKGRAYIIYGRKTGFPETMSASSGMTLIGYKEGDNFGCTVSGAGDFNGDGLQDVIIGAYAANGGRGGAYVLLGSRQNPGTLSMNTMEASTTRGFSLMQPSFSQLGLTVSGGRDLNGDGKDEIIIAGPGLNNNKGAVYVIYGYQTSGSFTDILLDIPLTSKQGYVLNGLKEGDRFGSSVRPLKDVNNDGVNDLIVGATGANNGKGSAYLFYTAWSCPNQCLSCTKPNTCDNWVCPQNCKKCSGPNICENWNCPDKCAKCSSPTTCDAWICPDKCAKCSSPSTCDVWRCPENCVSCAKPDVCDACVSGFAFIDNKCAVCPSTTHFIQDGYCFETLDKWKPIKDFFGGLFG